MAYGEDGAAIDDTPRQLKRPPMKQKTEPDVDRFDEGTYLYYFAHGQTTSNALSVSVSQACKILKVWFPRDIGKAIWQALYTYRITWLKAIEKLKIFQSKTNY